MTSVLAIRQAVQRVLDDAGVYPLSSASGTTGVISALINGAANASTSTFNGKWIYVATGTNANQQRKIRNGSYVPSTGTVTVDPGWSAPSAGDLVEITNLFPSIAAVPPENTSYLNLINRGLGKLLVPDRVTRPITTASSYDTSDLQWLDRPERLVRVLEPSPVGRQAVDCAWRGPKLILDAQTPSIQLDTPFETGTVGVLTLEVLRPADTWVSTSGVWAENAGNSLVLDTQEVKVALQDAVTVVLVEAYAALANRSPGVPSGPWATKYADALAAAQQLRYFDTTSTRPQPAAAPQGAPQQQGQMMIPGAA